MTAHACAFLDGRLVLATDLDRDDDLRREADLAARSPERTLVESLAPGARRLHLSRNGWHHFFSLYAGEADDGAVPGFTRPESMEHLELKGLVAATVADRPGWEVVGEEVWVPEVSRRADVMVTDPSGRRWAIEPQRSPMSPDAKAYSFAERTADYARAGVGVLWLVRHGRAGDGGRTEHPGRPCCFVPAGCPHLTYLPTPGGFTAAGMDLTAALRSWMGDVDGEDTKVRHGDDCPGGAPVADGGAWRCPACGAELESDDVESARARVPGCSSPDWKRGFMPDDAVHEPLAGADDSPVVVRTVGERRFQLLGESLLVGGFTTIRAGAVAAAWEMERSLRRGARTSARRRRHDALVRVAEETERRYREDRYRGTARARSADARAARALSMLVRDGFKALTVVTASCSSGHAWRFVRGPRDASRAGQAVHAATTVLSATDSGMMESSSMRCPVCGVAGLQVGTQRLRVTRKGIAP